MFIRRKWAIICILAALLTIVNWNAAGESQFSKSLAKLKAATPECRNSFDFVIVGDTQFPETFKYQPEVYSMIHDWNILLPPAIFIVGDLILGSTADTVEKQWDYFDKTFGEVKSPLFGVAGGHDICDKATEEIYIKRIAPIMYSLPIGNSLFIALDTEEPGQPPGVLSDKQISWLKNELSKAKAENIFIMMHQSIFDSKEYGNGWDRVAELFKGHPVRAVFCGHRHYYRDWGIRDGVRYIISGGGGGNRTGTPEDEGGYAHYMIVQVRGESVNYIVVRPGNILPTDTVTQLRVNEKHDLKKRITTEPIEVPYGEQIDSDVIVSANNPYPWRLALDLKWKSPKGWHVSPEILRIDADPNRRCEAKIHVRTDSPESTRFPVPSLETVVSKANNGGPITIENKLDFIPVGYAVHAPENMVIDGNLNEWKSSQVLLLVYPYGFDPKDTADLKSEIRFMWDEKYLYLLVDTYDDEYCQPYSGDIVWAADSVEFFLDKWHWEFSLTSKGNEVFLSEAPAGREIEVMNKIVKLSIHRDGTHIIYEAALPSSEIAPLELKKGNTFSTTLIMNDLDMKKGTSRHWLELTPGWGEFCTGPMAKIILK